MLNIAGKWKIVRNFLSYITFVTGVVLVLHFYLQLNSRDKSILHFSSPTLASHISAERRSNTENSGHQIKNDDGGGQQSNYTKGQLPSKGKEIKFISFQYVINSNMRIIFVGTDLQKHYVKLTTDYSYLFCKEINPPPPKYC